jgi:TonB family protein
MKNNRIVGLVKKNTKDGYFTGNFTKDGLPTGKWIHRTTGNNIYETTEIYQQGCLVKRIRKNVSTGALETEKLDMENAVDPERFFSVYDSINNSALIDGINYKLDYSGKGYIPTYAERLIVTRLTSSECEPSRFKGEEKYAGIPFKRIVVDKEKAGVKESGIDIRDLAEQKVVVQKEKPQIFSHVEVPPQFPGGEKELMKWLSENIKYPKNAAEQGIQGRVVLRFVVTPDGSVEYVEVQRSLDPSCDKEAVRVVKEMPKWVPGKQNGNAVYVYYTLPILFKLQK